MNDKMTFQTFSRVSRDRRTDDKTVFFTKITKNEHSHKKTQRTRKYYDMIIQMLFHIQQTYNKIGLVIDTK